jgi:AraC-like DNA-binding protein
MPREKPLFRENLDRLDVKFPDKEVLQYADIAQYLGVSKSTVQRHFKKEYNKKLHGISKSVVASALS